MTKEKAAFIPRINPWAFPPLKVVNIAANTNIDGTIPIVLTQRSIYGPNASCALNIKKPPYTTSSMSQSLPTIMSVTPSFLASSGRKYHSTRYFSVYCLGVIFV